MPSLLRRLFGGRPLRERLRSRWQWMHMPLPQYTAGTPRISGTGPRELFLPPNPATLAAAAQQTTSAVSAILARLTQLDEIVDTQTFYHWSQEKFGEHWRYADLLTTLWAAATFLQPKSYLEIGVRTGRSAAVVGATAPQCDIYGLDLWLPDYAGAANPGPDFVRRELRAVGHTGCVTLVSGDSRETLPAFLREHPDLYFDLITIDGTKSILGAAADFANALPRLKVGGVLVYDDVCMAPHLQRLWEIVIKRDPRLVSWEFLDGWYGVAAAVRMADEPLVASLFQQE